MESSTITPTAARAVDAPTLTEAFRRTAANNPDIIAVRWPDDSVSLTWAQLLERVDAVAGGLAKLGLGRGDTVAIMLNNRPEFHIVDLAAVTIGATPFSIYITYPAEEIRYLVTDADARVAIIEQAFLPVVLEARKELPGLETIIVVDGEAQPDDSGAAQSGEAGRRARGLPEGTISLADIEGSNPDFDATAAAAEVTPEDVLTLIYTSGTTGHPKGVQLSHQAIMFSAKSVEEIIVLDAGSRVISWLPSAHIAERNAHHYIPVIYAGSITCCPNPREILSYLPKVRPVWFFAVPRIWEKLKAGLETMLAAQPEEQRAPMQAAIDAAIERVRLQQRREPVPEQLEAQVAEADEKIFSNLRVMLGLDQAVAVNVGAAPTPVEVLEYFHALGIELLRAVGHVGDMRRSAPSTAPGGSRSEPSGRRRRASRSGSPKTARCCCAGTCVMLGYRNDPREDRRGDRRRRLAAHRRHRRARRGGLPEDRRPQEGADHQRRRQEHVAGEHRGGDQDRQPADRPGLRDR